mgnify:CR=1 FL=1
MTSVRNEIKYRRTSNDYRNKTEETLNPEYSFSKKYRRKFDKQLLKLTSSSFQAVETPRTFFYYIHQLFVKLPQET